MSIIEIKDLSYTYPTGQTALKDINISIPEGEFTAIIGQNGAGKSTLMKNITGLLEPTGGRITIDGKDSTEYTMAQLSSVVGYVLQNPDRQLFSDTVYEEIAFGPRNLGIEGEELKTRIQETMQSVHIEHLADEYPPSLSKGDRAKVVIASVMAMRAKILILDEPTGGQDYDGRYQILEIAKELNRNGYTIIIVTHAMSLVAEYADRIIVLCEGKTLLDGDSRTVFSQPEILRKTFIYPPQIVQLSKDVFGGDEGQEIHLTVDEVFDEIKNRLKVKSALRS